MLRMLLNSRFNALNLEKKKQVIKKLPITFVQK